MSASDALGRQFGFTRENENGVHQLDHPHGFIAWSPDSGTVDRIEVDPAHRRKGIGTMLWKKAQQITPHLQHDIDSEMTPDGRAWARKVGGPNAPR